MTSCWAAIHPNGDTNQDPGNAIHNVILPSSRLGEEHFIAKFSFHSMPNRLNCKQWASFEFLDSTRPGKPCGLWPEYAVKDNWIAGAEIVQEIKRICRRVRQQQAP